MPSLPNILITGTPGVGKSTLASSVSEALGFSHLNVSDLVKGNNLYSSYDDEMQTHILDDDLLIDHLEPLVAPGGAVVDFHSPEVFPLRYFSLVLVLRTTTATLFDRLQGVCVQ